MPISGTHTIVGALIGAGIVGVGFNNLNMSELVAIIVSWVASPLMAALLSCFMVVFICKFVLNGKKYPFTTRFSVLCLLSGINLVVIYTLIY